MNEDIAYAKKAILSVTSAPDYNKWSNMMQQLLNDNKKIFIFTDYDCDGVCSYGVIYYALLALGVNRERIKTLVPNRINGYGLTKKYLEDYMDHYQSDIVKGSWLITADNGINEQEIFNWLIDKLNFKVIASDHHEQDKFNKEKIHNKDNCVIFDPFKYDKEYTYKGVSGTTLIWKLFISLSYDLGKKEVANKLVSQLMDLVGVSTISDLMPKSKENDIWIKMGLAVLNRNNNYMWNAYKESSDIEEINEREIGWGIAPKINADSRVNLGCDNAIKLMQHKDDYEYEKKMWDKLNDTNNERKEIKKNLIKKHQIRSKGHVSLITRHDRDMQPFCGLAASKLYEMSERPEIVLFQHDKQLDGSARSLGKFNLVKDLKDNELNKLGLIINGHDKAAGVTIKDYHNIGKIADRINEIINSHDNEYFYEDDWNDLPSAEDFTLESFEDYLIENNNKSINCRLNNSIKFKSGKLFGNDEHKSVQYTNDKSEIIDLKLWDYSFFKEEGIINDEQSYLVSGNLSINEWMGRKSLQMNIDKLRRVD